MKIECRISEDGMQAMIAVTEFQAEKGKVTAEMIKEALGEQKVVAGIINDNLNALVKKLNDPNFTQHATDYETIAQGKKAVDPAVPAIKWVMQAAKDPGQVAKMKSLAEQHLLSPQNLTTDFPGLLSVKKGDVLGEVELGEPGKEGFDVYDKVIRFEPGIKLEQMISDHSGDNITLEKTSLKAAATGIFVQEGDLVSVLLIQEKPAIEIKLSENRVKAFLSLFPASDGNTAIDEKEIYSEIETLKIKRGIKKEAVKTALKEFKNSSKGIESVVIASGDEPVAGKDGRIQLLVNLEQDLKPKVDEKGNVDFKSIQFFTSVKKGDPLAKLLDPVPGKNGMDVFDNVISAEEGKSVKMPAGTNTQISPENDHLLIAQKEGVVVETDGILKIDQLLKVNGDVNFKTGSLTFEGSIEVRGDVKSGFNVKAGGDVSILGCLEDSQLDAEGNVIIQQGFTGEGKGVIRCKGTCQAGFIHSQKIEAGQKVSISRECFDSQIYSHDVLKVEGSPVSIVGGHLMALNAIDANVIGNESGTETKIEVGKNIFIQQQIDVIQKKTEALKETIKFIKEEVEAMQKDKTALNKLPPSQEQLMAKAKKFLPLMTSHIQRMESKIPGLSSKIYKSGECIIKAKKFFPAVTIVIKDVSFRVKELMQDKTFYLKGKEIKW